MLFYLSSHSCKENIINCDSINLSKYSGLVEIIKINKWLLDLFALEVGAHGYLCQSLNYLEETRLNIINPNTIFNKFLQLDE